MMRTAFVTIFGHEHLDFITSESDISITVQRFSFLLPNDIKANCFGLQVLSRGLRRDTSQRYYIDTVLRQLSPLDMISVKRCYLSSFVYITH
jgi:hypothetical protein